MAPIRLGGVEFIRMLETSPIEEKVMQNSSSEIGDVEMAFWDPKLEDWAFSTYLTGRQLCRGHLNHAC